MPKSRQKTNPARKPKRPPVYDPTLLMAALEPELFDSIEEKLSLDELIRLDGQLRKYYSGLLLTVTRDAATETNKKAFACAFRALRDRFGFGSRRLHRFFSTANSYIIDIDEGRLTTSEMLETLRNEDKIDIDWRIDLW